MSWNRHLAKSLREFRQYGDWIPEAVEEPSMRDVLKRMLDTLPQEVLDCPITAVETDLLVKPPRQAMSSDFPEVWFVAWKVWYDEGEG